MNARIDTPAAAPAAALPGTWKLARGRAITLRPATDGILRVAHGQLWATKDGPHGGTPFDAGDHVLGVGGAMDLLVGARTVIVTTTHTAKDGSPKIVDTATYPLTALRPVDVVVTEAATFRVKDGGLVLVEVAEDVTLDWVREHTSASFTVELAEVAHA